MMMQPNYRRGFAGKGPFQAPFDANIGAESEQLYQVKVALFYSFTLLPKLKSTSRRYL